MCDLSIFPIQFLISNSSESFHIVISVNDSDTIINQLNKMNYKGEIILKDELSMQYNSSYEMLRFPKCNTPEVSVCLTAYNKWNMTYNCLNSLLHNENETSFEVILGDNSSDDFTKNADYLLENVEVIHHKRNLQYLGNANFIANKAKGKFILLLSNDVLFTKKRYIDSLVNFMKDNSNVAMCSGKLWVPSKNKYDVHFIYDSWDKSVEIELQKVPVCVENMWPVAALIRRDVWNLVGGYDSIFLPVYFEDNDLELKIISRGYYIVAYPNAECIHYCGATYKYDQNDERIKRNKKLFGERWEKYFKNTEKRKEYLRKEWN